MNSLRSPARRVTVLCSAVSALLLTAGCGGSHDLTSTPTTQSTYTTTSSSPGTPVCALGDLDLSLGRSEGAAGTTYRALVFTNTGRVPCTVQGFPRVLLVAGTDRHQVGAPAEPVGTVGPAVRLKADDSATAPVGFVNPGNFEPESCQPTDVAGLHVSPPDGQEAGFLPLGITACSADNFQNMTVRTVHAGSDLT